MVTELNPEGLRPSIETTLHALLPHQVVVHTHSVRTIALAIRTDAEAQLARRLDGLDWLYVPYRKPGLPLTQLIAKRLRRAAGRHHRARQPRSGRGCRERRGRRPPAARGGATARGTGARGAGWRSRCARAGCGRAGPARGEARARAHGGDRPAADAPGHRRLALPGPRDLPRPRCRHRPAATLRAPASSSSSPVPACCSRPTRRTAPTSSPCAWPSSWSACPRMPSCAISTAADVAELLDWDAEKYRQSLARARR